MNCFVEGLQGSGKSTLLEKLSKRYPACTVFHEGDYSPVLLDMRGTAFLFIRGVFLSLILWIYSVLAPFLKQVSFRRIHTTDG